MRVSMMVSQGEGEKEKVEGEGADIVEDAARSNKATSQYASYKVGIVGRQRATDMVRSRWAIVRS
jgi:hypothetical protein